MYEYFRNESLNANRWAPPGVESGKDPLDRDQFGGAIGGPIVKDKTFFFASYSGLRQEGTRLPATRPSCQPTSSGPATSRSRPSSPGTRSPASPSPGGSSRPRASTRPPSTIQDRYLPAGQPAEQLLRGPGRRPPGNRRGVASSWTTTSRPRTCSALSYFYQKGTDMQPLLDLRQHPLGGPRLHLDPAQREPVQHPHPEPDDDQPVPRDLRPSVRRAHQQPDDLARRPQLELHDPGRPDPPAPHRLRVLRGPGPDRRPRRRQRLLGLQGHAERQPRQPLLEVRGRGLVRDRSSTTPCSTTTASSRSTGARPATPMPTSCWAFRTR